MDNCVIFGGYTDELDEGIVDFIDDNTYIICADKGYYSCLKLGLVPDLIVGDFDSSNKPETNIETIVLPVKKDDTDLHFAVKTAISRGYKKIILSSVTGGRLDQTTASFFTMNYAFSKGVKIQIYDLSTKVFLTDSSVSIKRPDYTSYFSVFPFGCEMAEGVSISGAEYNLNKVTLKSDFPIGVSNCFKENCITVSVCKGKLLIMIIKENI